MFGYFTFYWKDKLNVGKALCGEAENIGFLRQVIDNVLLTGFGALLGATTKLACFYFYSMKRRFILNLVG